jgi:subtilisin family serine protease
LRGIPFPQEAGDFSVFFRLRTSRAKRARNRLKIRACLRTSLSAPLALSGALLLAEDGAGKVTTVSNPVNWGLQRIDRPGLPLGGEFHYTTDGAGVNIYVIDTGVLRSAEDFIDLQGNSRVTYVGDFCTGVRRPPERSAYETYDDGYDGHGTHNASYAAGRQAGVAKNAKIFSLRAQGASAHGQVSPDGPGCGDAATQPSLAVKAAVDWITQHAQRPAVVNLSFCCYASSVWEAIHSSISAGFVYSLSAGTGGDVVAHWGGQLAKEALIVGGTRIDDSPLATSYGGALSLFAPAQGLCGAGIGLGPRGECLSGYSVPETAQGNHPAGDSFAAPWATGVVAAYLQQHKGATPAQVRTEIMSHAAPVAGLPQKVLQMVREDIEGL